MKYLPIPKDLFVKNRKKFTSRMKSSSIAVFNSNDIYPISADSVFPFQQHRDIFYLTGIDQEESILLLFPNAYEEKHKEILFLKETNEHIAIWEGKKLSKEQAFECSGIETVYWLDDFRSVFYQLMTQCEFIYFNTNEHYRQSSKTETREDRFIKWCKNKYPVHQCLKSNTILQSIRSVKEPEELELMKQACCITEKGFRRILDFVKPGVFEFEIEAEYICEFIRNRSRGFAYSPIIASGSNANILHYIENNRQCREGELLLMDVAAEYANYSSDMTRTIPVSGVFSDRQKQIYEAVLCVKKEATKLLVPGTLWKEYHIEVGKIMTDQLLNIGLLDKADVQNESKDRPAYKKYFMHGTSHHIGLDTHDYGLLNNPMKANMVFTVEPGIYIPKENLGIRLEDNVVVQENGNPINLMENIPIETEEIENLMNA